MRKKERERKEKNEKLHGFDSDGLVVKRLMCAYLRILPIWRSERRGREG